MEKPKLNLTPEEQAAAEQANVQPDEITMPPQMVLGAIVYQKDNGDWGIQPLGSDPEDVDMTEIAGLLFRALLGIATDLGSLKTVSHLKRKSSIWKPGQ